MLRLSPRSALGPLVLALAASTCAASYAQSDNATVDPNSPAGTEYQIPVATARDEGRSDSAGRKTGKDSLFGEGIKPKSSSAIDSKAAGGGKTPGVKRSASSGTPAPSAVVPSSEAPAGQSRLAAANTDSPSTSGGTLAAIAGGSLVLVLLAAAFGGYLRQRSGPRAKAPDPR